MSLKELPPDLKRPRDGVEPYDENWKAWVAEIEAYLGYKVCGRRTARKTPCPKRPIKDRKGCSKHGGKTLRGPQHPNWKDGRASLYKELLPQDIHDKYERLVNDPQLLAMNSDIALLEIRQMDLYRDFRAGMDPALALRNVLEEVNNLRVAVAEGNKVNIGVAAETIAECAQAGVDTAKAWDQFMATTESKRRIVETESRRLERMRVTMTAEEARTRDQMLLAIIIQSMKLVTNEAEQRAVLQKVVTEVSRLSGIVMEDKRLIPAKEVGHGQ